MRHLIPDVTILLALCVLAPCDLSAQVSEPVPRRAHMMVSTGDELVMWGGLGGSATGTVYLDDTWSYSPEDKWTFLCKGGPAAYRGTGTLDTQRNVIVAFGGRTRDGFSHALHEFDPATKEWAKVATEGPNPTARFSAALAYIPGYGVLLTGGANQAEGMEIFDDTWVWNGSRWREIETPGYSPIYCHSLAWDSVRKKAVQFGGLREDGSCCNETWEFDPKTEEWTQVETEVSPPAMMLHSTASIPGKGVVVGYGRTTGVETPFFDDFWLFDGRQWRTAGDRKHDVSARYCSQAAYLENVGLFIFGGERGFGPYECSVYGERLGDISIVMAAQDLQDW